MQELVRVNWKKYSIDKKKMKLLIPKAKLSAQIETQSTEKQNATDPGISKQMLRLEGRINVDEIKTIITEEKNTLTSYKNQNWKKWKQKSKR